MDKTFVVSYTLSSYNSSKDKVVKKLVNANKLQAFLKQISAVHGTINNIKSC